MSDCTNRAFLSKETTLALKGILACMVLASHLQGRTDLFDSSILGTVFYVFGYLAVSVFFFLSGFGLYEQVKRNSDYIRNFPKRRLLPFFCVCVLTITIYLIRNLIICHCVDWKKLLMSFLIGDTIVDNGWYLQVQMLMYIAFFVTFLFMKRWRIVSVAIIAAAFCVICFLVNTDTTWYETVFCFVLGLIVSLYKTKIEEFLAKKSRSLVALLAFMVMFVIALVLGNKSGWLPTPLRIVIKMLSSMLFIPCVVIPSNIINVSNIVTRFLGRISLEIYILQGIALNLFSKTIKIENDWLYILAVITTTVLISMLFHPLFAKINGIGKKRLRGEK